MEFNDESVKEITSETSFWGLLRLVCKIPFNFENLAIPLLFFVFYSLGGIIQVNKTISITVSSVVDSAKDIVGWNYTILGFLIAGYTIFSTITSLDLSVALSQKKHPQSGISHLKHIHAIFFKTIIIFFISGSFTLLVVFLSKNPIIIFSFREIFSSYTRKIIIALIDATNMALFIFSLMMLKSFLFNIYSSVMMSVRWKIQQDQSNN